MGPEEKEKVFRTYAKTKEASFPVIVDIFYGVGYLSFNMTLVYPTTH